MLIKVFGIWLMANSILFLDKEGAGCKVIYGYAGKFGTEAGLVFRESCDEVAAEINRQLREEGK